LPYTVILPREYFQTGQQYPVFYLMHGLFGNFENWPMLTDLVNYAQTYNFIIVCPEGGNHWYTDNPSFEKHFYESYLLNELIPDVEKRFRVKNERTSRAIGGLSMGGYGAFKFAFRQPDLFCSAYSMSGAFDIRSFLENKENLWDELYPSVAEAYKDQDRKSIDDEDLFKLAENLAGENSESLPFLYFDCGIEDSFLEINRKFSKLLTKLDIRHLYREFPGGHDWIYWNRRIKSVLKLVDENLI
jgi:S-formylglutathione hydrolase FrmB